MIGGRLGFRARDVGVVRVCAMAEIVFGCVQSVRIAKCGSLDGVSGVGAKGLRRCGADSALK